MVCFVQILSIQPHVAMVFFVTVWKIYTAYFVISGRKFEILKDQTVLLFWYAASMY